MFLPSKYAEEPPEDRLKPVSRLLRRKLRNSRLLADNQLNLRDEVGDELTVRRDRLEEGPSPLINLLFAFPQDWRISIWNACANVPYGMSLLCLSNFLR